MGRYLSGVPLRVLHLTLSTGSSQTQLDYGQVTAAACRRCHSSALAGVTENTTRGLKISHAEPMAAAATCTDCHTLRGGVVSAHNVGMKLCLRCHNDKTASSKCKTCHDEKASVAARARTTAFQAEQIEEVRCGGCHVQKRDCDPCHGLRMPHTTAFMAGAHARAAVVDFWYNDGKLCSRCHTATRRPCQQCHSSLIGKAHGRSMINHSTATATSCNTCHGQYATFATRDFCKDVCHTDAAISASPR